MCDYVYYIKHTQKYFQNALVHVIIMRAIEFTLVIHKIFLLLPQDHKKGN